MMNMLLALWQHVWLVFRLKHDGTGMPEKIPAAMMLAFIYVLLCLANAHMADDMSLHNIIGLSFVMQIYVFALRQPLIGLIILIGIVANTFSLVLYLVAAGTQQAMLMVTLMELVMILGAVINALKKESSII